MAKDQLIDRGWAYDQYHHNTGKLSQIVLYLSLVVLLIQPHNKLGVLALLVNIGGYLYMATYYWCQATFPKLFACTVQVHNKWIYAADFLFFGKVLLGSVLLISLY